MKPQRREILTICPKCGCKDLFIRKDFPQKLGMSIVIAAAVLDALLYWFVPKITVCYRCRAEFRDVPINPDHEAYELAVGEKYRRRESP